MTSKSIDALSGLVVITGASSGIGLELARRAGEDGVSLLLVADTDLGEGEAAARGAGASEVETLLVDLGTQDGVAQVLAKIANRPVSALFANAGHGLGQKFLDQDWDEARKVIDVNVTGTTQLIHAVGRQMRVQGAGRILVTGSTAGHMAGTDQLVYNSTKAYVNNFCIGLAHELQGTGVYVTCLEPGPVETEFFERAGMMDTRVGQSDNKDDPAKVARDGYKAMLAGHDEIVSGFMNKVQAIFGNILPNDLVAEIHRKMAEPKQGEPKR